MLAPQRGQLVRRRARAVVAAGDAVGAARSAGPGSRGCSSASTCPSPTGRRSRPSRRPRWSGPGLLSAATTWSPAGKSRRRRLQLGEAAAHGLAARPCRRHSRAGRGRPWRAPRLRRRRPCRRPSGRSSPRRESCCSGRSRPCAPRPCRRPGRRERYGCRRRSRPSAADGNGRDLQRLWLSTTWTSAVMPGAGRRPCSARRRGRCSRSRPSARRRPGSSTPVVGRQFAGAQGGVVARSGSPRMVK